MTVSVSASQQHEGDPQPNVARWSAFFELLGWECRPEPFRLGSWSNDFIVSRQRSSRLLAVCVSPDPVIYGIDPNPMDMVWDGFDFSNNFGVLHVGPEPDFSGTLSFIGSLRTRQTPTFYPVGACWLGSPAVDLVIPGRRGGLWDRWFSGSESHVPWSRSFNDLIARRWNEAASLAAAS